MNFENHEIKAYKFDIVTKYYQTQIALFECEDITAVPDAVLANVEGVIVFFDPDDVSIYIKPYVYKNLSNYKYINL